MSRRRSKVVTAVTQLRWLAYDPTDAGLADDGPAGSVPVRARWTWDGADPWAVGLALSSGVAEWVEWQIGVELLSAAITGPAGVGDVTFSPYPGSSDHRLLHLSSPHGDAWLRVSSGWLAGFLARLDDPRLLGAELVAALDPDDFAPGGRYDRQPLDDRQLLDEDDPR